MYILYNHIINCIKVLPKDRTDVHNEEKYEEEQQCSKVSKMNGWQLFYHENYVSYLNSLVFGFLKNRFKNQQIRFKKTYQKGYQIFSKVRFLLLYQFLMDSLSFLYFGKNKL